ncbi:response regulator transcription factor [Teredinibacter sp. KSP-S5-2]|uniref:response regulator transcription factor n=1 Tax=Teredinibacter sp. KSP-S5-2 TaxID=3034506 RepID=UPI0029350126|nr:response regulator [Teredinibacter sp. KSP-S5-2]WNO11366.1 response regulator [Teredinibacter sp. KSP-S5-2]
MVKKLLLIEDDQALGTVTKAGIEAQGMLVSWARDLDGARECCSEQRFDFAVLDLKLENEVSLQFIPELIGLFPEIKILMLTGYASIATAVEAVKLGAVNYLPKPANISEILAALNEGADSTTVEIEDSVMSTKRLEWEHIQRVLAKNNGNVSAAARELNMHRRTLQRKLQKKPVKK